jgi:adenylylsulfate kinase
VAYRLEERLFQRGIKACVLDGDNIRTGLNRDLGFSAEDREENIRRIGEVAKLFVDSGMFAITAFISPYRKDREHARSKVDNGEFIEIYVKCPLEICMKRDVKDLYKKAKQGLIKNFTGIDDVYEEPLDPEITVDTKTLEVEEGVEKILVYLEENGYIKKSV